MLLHRKLTADGSAYSYQEIADWAREKGLEVSHATVKRHWDRDLQPAVQQAVFINGTLDKILARAGGDALRTLYAMEVVTAFDLLWSITEDDLRKLSVGEKLEYAAQISNVALKLRAALADDQSAYLKALEVIKSQLAAAGTKSDMVDALLSAAYPDKASGALN
jgi:hypothetical protein